MLQSGMQGCSDGLVVPVPCEQMHAKCRTAGRTRHVPGAASGWKPRRCLCSPSQARACLAAEHRSSATASAGSCAMAVWLKVEVVPQDQQTWQPSGDSHGGSGWGGWGGHSSDGGWQAEGSPSWPHAEEWGWSGQSSDAWAKHAGWHTEGSRGWPHARAQWRAAGGGEGADPAPRHRGGRKWSRERKRAASAAAAAGREGGGQSDGGCGERSEGRGRRYDEEYVAKYSAVARGRLERDATSQAWGTPPTPPGGDEQGDTEPRQPCSSGKGKSGGSARGSVVQLLPAPQPKGMPRRAAAASAVRSTAELQAASAKTAGTIATGPQAKAARQPAARPAGAIGDAPQAKVARQEQGETKVPAPQTPPVQPVTKAQKIKQLLQELVAESPGTAPAVLASQAVVPVWSPMAMWAPQPGQMAPVWPGQQVASGWAPQSMPQLFVAGQPQLVPLPVHNQEGSETRGMTLQRQMLAKCAASRAGQTAAQGNVSGSGGAPQIPRPAKVPVIRL